jgi:hypothetical protein
MTLLELSPPVNTTGTYAAVTFSPKTIAKLIRFCEENGVKNVLNADKFHTTLIYSRKEMPDYKAAGDLKTKLIGEPEELLIWKTRSEDKDKKPSNCLVLKYKCPALVARHNQLMKEHEGTYDFDEFTPHITLSYNIGDDSIDHLQEKLKEFGEIEIDHEYTEKLDLNWATKK